VLSLGIRKPHFAFDIQNELPLAEAATLAMGIRRSYLTDDTTLSGETFVR
jgi:hypothetical protein